MKTLLSAFATAAALALASTASYAADLAGDTSYSPLVSVATPVTKSGFTWTGPYIGANVGGIWDDQEMPLGHKEDYQAFTGGGQAGFNWQAGLFVFGVEGDLNYVDGVQDYHYADRTTVDGVDLNIDTSLKGGLEWIGTLRGRLGYAADRFFVYGTGGLAFGAARSSFDTTIGLANAPSPVDTYSGKEAETRYGWTLGAGAEYAITNNLTGKLEALYYDLGHSGYTVGNLNPLYPEDAVRVRSHYEGTAVRAGVNLKW